MDLLAEMRNLSLGTLASVGVGLLLMVVTLGLFQLVLPFSMKKAISGEHNRAVSIILCSILIGLGIILTATVQHGSGG